MGRNEVYGDTLCCCSVFFCALIFSERGWSDGCGERGESLETRKLQLPEVREPGSPEVFASSEMPRHVPHQLPTPFYKNSGQLTHCCAV